MDDAKQDSSVSEDQKPTPVVKYYPLSIFHNQAMVTSFSCVTCGRIANKCFNNEENAEILCPECAHKAIQNGIKCVVSHTIQKMVNNLTVKCMNNDDKILLQKSTEEDEEVEGDNVGIIVCSWNGKLLNWSSHSKSECSLLTVECPFAKYGCTIAMNNDGKNLTRDELQIHLKESESQHAVQQMRHEMRLLQETVNRLMLENKMKDVKIQSLEDKLMNNESGKEEKKRLMHHLSAGNGYSFNYTQDFDEGGIMYFLGTDWRTSPWKNPAESGIVSAISSRLGKDSTPASALCGRSVVSNDLKKFTILKEHKNDKSLFGKGSTHTWAVNVKGKRYRAFHIRQFDVNSNKHWYLVCSGIEFYGEIYFRPA